MLCYAMLWKFSLFGDTVNTAARMQSTGEPMHVHMSAKAKAEYLTALPPDHELRTRVTFRARTITAKGKGELQTALVVDAVATRAATWQQIAKGLGDRPQIKKGPTRRRSMLTQLVLGGAGQLAARLSSAGHPSRCASARPAVPNRDWRRASSGTPRRRPVT